MASFLYMLNIRKPRPLGVVFTFQNFSRLPL